MAAGCTAAAGTAAGTWVAAGTGAEGSKMGEGGSLAGCHCCHPHHPRPACCAYLHVLLCHPVQTDEQEQKQVNTAGLKQ
jgi:hypothetical protein